MHNQDFSKSLSSINLSPIVGISELVRNRAPEFRERTGEDFVYWQRGEINSPSAATSPLGLTSDGSTRCPDAAIRDDF